MKTSIKIKDCYLEKTKITVAKNNFNYIIGHSISIVKFPSRASPTNYDVIKSMDVNQLSYFLANFSKFLGWVNNVETIKHILNSKAAI